MIPIRDDNPTTLTPVVTVSLIVACVLVFLWQVSLPPSLAQRAVYSYGLIPAVLVGEAELVAELAAIPASASLFTSMFMHGGWLHLIGNMLYLWIFGNNIEDSMGHLRFVIFYLLCGLGAATAQVLQDPTSTVPMIGASGAIAGVLGAYLLLFPRAHVVVIIPFGILLYPLRVPSVLVLSVWFVMQFISSAASAGQAGGVAYWAHIGGFVTGAVLILFFRRPGFPLFGGPRRVPLSGSLRPPQRPFRRRRRDDDDFGPWS
ncbi:MAG TPA: rhomboid family intramembrane serine protease [Kiloniellales bacterium]|nr:rhomboid family intramembrane serine protease [Kiloniellales bacterium]